MEDSQNQPVLVTDRLNCQSGVSRACVRTYNDTAPHERNKQAKRLKKKNNNNTTQSIHHSFHLSKVLVFINDGIIT